MARTASTRHARNHSPNTTAAEALRQAAEREQAAEDQREDAADYRRTGEHPTEPSMEGVVATADPVGELERCQEQVQRTGTMCRYASHGCAT
jgi:hypothetical protein